MKRSILIPILLAALMVCGLCSPAWATTWYAQGSTVNIDAFTSYKSTVWNDAANGSGNWMVNGLLLDPGTYYAWRSKAGYSFTNPHAITVP